MKRIGASKIGPIIFAVIWGTLGFFPGVSLAQTNAMPGVAWGPSIPVTTLQRDASGDWMGGFMDAGAGMSAKFYPDFLKNYDSSLAYLGFELPFYLSIVEGSLDYRVGALVNFFNGLVGIGLDVTAANTTTDRGFLLGSVKWPEDTRILLVWGFNITSGVSVARENRSGKTQSIEVTHDRPFNCVGW
jgi:hypothetical protein